jgi:solute carrier family 35 protein E3
VEAIVTIFVSGCLGLLVSLSTFLMIGATSALTYNIVGHLKTVSILILGVLLYGDPMTVEKFFGIVLALTGVLGYSKLKLDKQTAEKAKQAQQKAAPTK